MSNKNGATICDDCATILHHGYSAAKNDFCWLCRAWRQRMAQLNMPETRQAATVANANWFLRQGWTLAHNHPLFNDAQEQAKELAKR